MGEKNIKTERGVNTEKKVVNPSGTKDISEQPEVTDEHFGYKSDFLGAEVPIPKLTPTQKKNVARSKGSLILDYVHFSICMNQKRRLAFFTAVNIDGNSLVKIIRKKDKWVFDERINETYQCGNDIYKNNKLDKGHLVRRLDPCWGPDPVAKRAETDTFHYTNASPQHANLNEKIWGDLEDYILMNTDKNNMKINVFTGQVFDAKNDPHYRDIQIPLRYWKVVTMIKENNELSATAYILDQANEMDNIEKPKFVFGEFRTYQTSIDDIERLTSLDFGDLKKHDPKAVKPGRFGISLRTCIDSFEQIVF
jgi:endonuclease G, mitochondrial